MHVYVHVLLVKRLIYIYTYVIYICACVNILMSHLYKIGTGYLSTNEYMYR